MYRLFCNDSSLFLEYKSSHAIDDIKQMEMVVLKNTQTYFKKQVVGKIWATDCGLSIPGLENE